VSDVVIEHLYRYGYPVSTRMAKIFASAFYVLVKIDFDLHFVADMHGRLAIAAICIELPGNSQIRTASTQRRSQLIGRLVNNHPELFGQSC